MRSRNIAQFGIIDFEEVTIFIEIRELRCNQGLQLFFRCADFIQLLEKQRIHLGDSEFQSAKIHLAFGFVIEVYGTFRNARGLGNIVHCCLMESFLRENFTSGLENS